MRRWIAPALWTLYVLWPAPGWGWLPGIPIGPIGISAISALWIAWFVRPVALGVVLPVACLVIKAALGAAIADRGFSAEYFANDRLTPPVERSVEYPRAPFTRIDSTLNFGPDAPADLPLAFFNDFLRFNFYQPTQPDRSTLPFSVAWTGHWYLRDDRTVTFDLRGEQVHAEAMLDGFPVVSLPIGPRGVQSSASVRSVSVRKGWRQLRVTLAAPSGAGRWFFAGTIEEDHRAVPFGEDIFVTRRSEGRLVADRVARVVGVVLDSILLAVLGCWAAATIVIGVRRQERRALIAGLAVLAVVDALLFARPWFGRLMLLGGGGDPLTYETYARDIIVNGPLMTFGRPLGEGEAFYYQPLYPYLLAIGHVIFGEGFFGVLFAQRLLVGVTALLVWTMMRELFGDRVGFVELVLGSAFLYVAVGRRADMLLGEIVFIPLVCWWTWTSIRVARGAEGVTAFGAGIAGGLATLARSTLFLAWPLVLSLAAIVRGRARRSPRAVAVMAVVMVAVTSAATIRNWFVARRFVPVTTSFSINFYLGNQPPASLPVHGVADHTFYEWIAREDTTRMALEYARHAPARFAGNLWHKALYTLGFFDAFVAGAGVSPLLIATWLAAAAGAVMLIRQDFGLRRAAVQLIPASVALAHFAAVTLIFPHVYGDRLILPFYALILPYALIPCQIRYTRSTS